MKNIIVGTAGHIDHGKTALVKALTGIDADRLQEEKRRGITIDIGFAHLQLAPDLRLGFVDVPGHERFVKNMLAGAGGIDLVLFVVAADESIKPQTREHFDICRLLGIRSGIIALTKSDLAGPELVELVRLEMEEFTAGSFLEGVPIVPVSSVTGAGLDDLRTALERAARAVPAKDAAGYFRLPIDRSFSVKGFGTVITGTLVSGSVRKEQEVELYPIGRRLRVRGVQVYGQPAEAARAGERTALNLADIEPADIMRGMTLSEPGRFQPTREFDAVLDLLPSAKPLKHRAPVHFHAGAAEIEAQVRMLASRAALQPGRRTYARIVLQEPALLLPGDRFIIRMFSPVTTIGGGTVLDIGSIRYRKADRPAERLQVLETGSPTARVALLVRESRYGMSLPQLVARTGLSETGIDPSAFVFLAAQSWVMDREWFQAGQKRLLESVKEFHQQQPLAPGIPKPDLRARLLPDAPPFVMDALLGAAHDIAVDGEIVRLRAHRVILREDETRARAKIEQAFERAGLAVPGVVEVLAGSGVEPARARSLLQILLREKRLVRISDDLVFHASQIEKLRVLLTAHRSQRFNVGTFKDWTGISRKYAIPLLEYLDREHITRREGDERLVL